MDKANTKRQERAERAKKIVRERRRIKVGTPATGLAGYAVPPGTTRTMHEAKVVKPKVGDKVLIDGRQQTKLGGMVTVGDFKGYELYTIALEERATCPKTCFHWRTCYGNSMPFTTRWEKGQRFERALDVDIHRKHAKGPLLVRLHLLGDFYSWDYLCKWADLLDTYPRLAAFGFTAWKPGTRIGDGIARLREVYPNRFAIRHSGMTGRWGSATLDFPTEFKKIGDMIACPEQIDSNRDNPRGKHCGNCAACWQSDAGVMFIQHGNTRPGSVKDDPV